MDNQYEPQGLLVGYTVENEHGLDGKVPGAGTIGCWYDNGKVGYYERYQGTTDAEIRCEVKAEERQVIMQEVAHPDANGEE